MRDGIKVADHETPLTFHFLDLLRYAGPGSPAGVAVAYQAMRVSFPLLAVRQPLARRDITIETAFRGPGARDGFELVTRAVTEGRYLVTPTLEHPERGTTLEQFVFRFAYRDRQCTLLVREGMVADEFITMARKPDRSPEEEQRFTEMKAQHMSQLLATEPADIFDVLQEHDGPPSQ